MPRNDFTDDDRNRDDRDEYRYDERGRLLTRGLDEFGGSHDERRARRVREGGIASEGARRFGSDDDDERRRLRGSREYSDARRMTERDDVDSDRVRYGYSTGRSNYGNIGGGIQPNTTGYSAWDDLGSRRVRDHDEERRDIGSRSRRGEDDRGERLRSTDKVMAADLMTEVLTTVRPDSSVIEAARLMRDEDIGALPVVDDRGRPLGVITDRDIVCRIVAEDEDLDRARVHRAMTDEVYACRIDDTLDEVLRTMSRHQVRRLLVVDRRDRLMGILSQADLARHAARHRRTNESREVAETIERISR